MIKTRRQFTPCLQDNISDASSIYTKMSFFFFISFANSFARLCYPFLCRFHLALFLILLCVWKFDAGMLVLNKFLLLVLQKKESKQILDWIIFEIEFPMLFWEYALTMVEHLLMGLDWSGHEIQITHSSRSRCCSSWNRFNFVDKTFYWQNVSLLSSRKILIRFGQKSIYLKRNLVYDKTTMCN